MILEFYFQLSYKAIFFTKHFFSKKKSMLSLHAIIRDVYIPLNALSLNQM